MFELVHVGLCAWHGVVARISHTHDAIAWLVCVMCVWCVCIHGRGGGVRLVSRFRMAVHRGAIVDHLAFDLSTTNVLRSA